MLDGTSLADFIDAVNEVGAAMLEETGVAPRVVNICASLLPVIQTIEEQTGLRVAVWRSLESQQFTLTRTEDCMKDRKDYWVGGVADSDSLEHIITKAYALVESSENKPTHIRLHDGLGREAQSDIAEALGLSLTSEGPIVAYKTYVYVGTLDSTVKPLFIKAARFWDAPDDPEMIYDEPSGTLDLTFEDGHEYTYYGVPKRVFKELRQSMDNPEERGSAFNRIIKNVYEGEKIA
jgi:hypothetical protein